MVKVLSLTNLDRDVNECILLGKWCYNKIEITDGLSKDYELNEYDQAGLDFHIKSNLMTKKAYMILLPILQKSLNKKLNSSYTKKFWDILLGAWLTQYLDILYERYATLINFKNKYNEEFHVNLIDPDKYFVPLNTDDFSVELFNDTLNHQIYGQIINQLDMFKKSYSINNFKNMNKIGRKKQNKLVLQIAIFLSKKLLNISKDVIVIKSYLSFKTLMIGFTKGLWLPLPYPPKFDDNKIHLLKKEREVSLNFNNIKNKNEFINLSKNLIKYNLPLIFFEGINELVNEAKKTFPKHTKKIITANPNAAGELVKCWIGIMKSKQDFKYYIMQHGANYGQSRVITDEDHELNVCDYFFSTGWKTNKSRNFLVNYVVSRLSGIGDFRINKTPKSKHNHIILVLASFPRYYYTGWSAPQAAEFDKHLTNVISLSESLNSNIFSNIICRGYTYDYGWNDRQRLENAGFKYPQNERRKPLTKIMYEAKLTIFSYNSTAFLEALSRNIICLAFWDIDQWPWRDEANKYLKLLEEVGIFHRSSKSIAEFLNEKIGNNTLLEWWNSESLQLVRQKFCSRYSYTSSNEVDEFFKIIK